MDMLFDLIGIIGMISFLVAYFFLQNGRLQPDGYVYLCTNLAGAVLLMISLTWKWNLSAFMLELAWFFISLYGIWRRWRKDKAAA